MGMGDEAQECFCLAWVARSSFFRQMFFGQDFMLAPEKISSTQLFLPW